MKSVLLCVLALSCAAMAADKIKEKEPGPKSTGKIYEWKSKDGLAYYYRIPKRFDPEKGANLTLILHGSNLTKGWGFANHSFKTFRPDDVVVSPDGTTSNGRGGFNFLDSKKDLDRLHDLQMELKKTLNLKSTYIYGHSQGSFYAFLYAGQFPEDVQGVVGHASGTWTSTRRPKKGHAQAIVLMHGTQDPVVPYGQSPGGYEAYVDAKYPMVRLRSLEGWNHWPAEHNSAIPHTSQQLAWCEGMTTDDPKRMDACFEFLASCKEKDYTDYAAVYTLACRLAEADSAPDALKRRAAAAKRTVEELAEAHVKAFGKNEPVAFEADRWACHVALFLRAFMDVPAREEYLETWGKSLEKQRKEGSKQFSKYWKAIRKGDKAKAFEAGVAAIKAGCFWLRVLDNEVLNNLVAWRKDARNLKLSKKTIKDFDEYVKPLSKAIKEGLRDFSAINRKCGKL
jgi:predicted esterase